MSACVCKREGKSDYEDVRNWAQVKGRERELKIVSL